MNFLKTEDVHFEPTDLKVSAEGIRYSLGR